MVSTFDLESSVPMRPVCSAKNFDVTVMLSYITSAPAILKKLTQIET